MEIHPRVYPFTSSLIYPIPTYSAAKTTLTRLTLSAMQTCSAHVYGFHCIGLVWMLVTAISHNNLKGRVD